MLMKKLELLSTMRARRTEWDNLLAQVGEEKMAQPGVAGEWSVKDVIAHVTWAERETAQLLEARKFVGSQLWELPQDERNSVVFELSRGRPLGEVLAEAKEVFQQLVETVEALSEEDLTDSTRFQDMPVDWIPWRVVVANSFAHYYQHIPDLRAWLDNLEKEP